jgi:putative methionine-R-sulfoxide reductase with GAF domain/PAS domain-containing protein
LSQYKAETNYIRDLLKKQPRGMTISEIAKAIGSNRNSTAKYLDVMHTSGEIEQRIVGRAKLYYPSQRIPLAALLDYSSDYIIVLNENHEIVQINNNLIEYLDLDKEALLGRHLCETPKQSYQHKELYQFVSNLLRNEVIEDIWETHDRCFRVKILKTVLNDGQQGKTLLFNDITDEIKFRDTLIELHRFSKALAECRTTDELFNHTRDAMISILGFDRVDIWMVEEDNLIQVTVNDALPKGFKIPLSGKGITVKVIKEKRTKMVKDVSCDPDYLFAFEVSDSDDARSFEPSKSELATPILADGEAIGVLNVESLFSNSFTDNDVVLIEILAIHVSNALKMIK